MITIPAGLHKVRVTLITVIAVTYCYTLVHSDYVVQPCARQIGSAAAEVTSSLLFCQMLLDRRRERPTY
jgi:hypothetical protein